MGCAISKWSEIFHACVNWWWARLTKFSLKYNCLRTQDALVFLFVFSMESRMSKYKPHFVFISQYIVRDVSKHITSINLLKSLQMDSKYHLIYSIFYTKKTTNSGKVKMLDFLIHDFDLTIYGALILHI